MEDAFSSKIKPVKRSRKMQSSEILSVVNFSARNTQIAIKSYNES